MSTKVRLGRTKLVVRKPRTIPIKIDVQRNPWDKAIKEMTIRRFAVGVMAKYTGLTYYQAQRRAQKLGGGLTQHRNGETAESKKVLTQIDQLYGAAKALKQQCREMRTHIHRRLARSRRVAQRQSA